MEGYGYGVIKPNLVTSVNDKDPKTRASALHELGIIIQKKAFRLERSQKGLLNKDQNAIISCFLHAVQEGNRRAFEEYKRSQKGVELDG